MIKRFVSALLSGNSSAYRGIVYLAIRPATRLINIFLRLLLSRQERDTTDLNGLIIIATSRSGATVINQVLTRGLKCVYYSNFHDLFPDVAHSFMKKHGHYGTSSMKRRNYYGYTTSLWDVNEANSMLSRVFSKQDKDSSQRLAKDLVKIGVENNIPIILKNVAYAEDLMALSKDFPGLHFIKIDRDPIHIARSVYQAYLELGYFNPIPDALKGEEVKDPIEFTVRQVMEMEKQLNVSWQSIPETNRHRWTYEEFCADPDGHLRKASELVGLNGEYRSVSSLGISLNASRKTNDQDARLREHLERLYPQA